MKWLPHITNQNSNMTPITNSTDGDNGRISHRPNGGPDLNYLYAPEEDDTTVQVYVRSDGSKRTKKAQKRGRKSDNRSLTGQTLYLGGEEASNGKIYCIPGLVV